MNIRRREGNQGCRTSGAVRIWKYIMQNNYSIASLTRELKAETPVLPPFIATGARIYKRSRHRKFRSKLLKRKKNTV